MNLYSNNYYEADVPYTRKYSRIRYTSKNIPTQWEFIENFNPYLAYSPYFYHSTGISKAIVSKLFFGPDLFCQKIYRFTNNKGFYYVTRNCIYDNNYDIACIMVKSYNEENYTLLIRQDIYYNKSLNKQIKQVEEKASSFDNVDICIVNRYRLNEFLNKVIDIRHSFNTEEVLDAIITNLCGYLTETEREELKVKEWFQEIQTEEKDTEQNSSTQELLETLDSLNALLADSEADSTTTQR